MTTHTFRPEAIPGEIYSKMFGIKSICREMKSPAVYREDCDLWVVATDEDGSVMGFGGLKHKKDGMWVEHLYTYPQHRGKGVCRSIIKRILEEPHETAISSCVEASRHVFQTLGFERLAGAGYRRGYHMIKMEKI